MIRSHRDLIVWQRSMDLAEKVYSATQDYPRDELFGPTSQTRRAAVSLPANIAEGYGRGTKASYASFLRIARGSLRELETHLELAERLSLLNRERAAAFLSDADEIGRMLHVLISRLREPQPKN